ncbi:inactive serine/threonine-protein kinase 19-like [Corticium candelabrum]|uniref:inactive serine/threonine-protein kinase 19-like n=1 Tax=Corticium candelabrum TaxID=121492 RepID=UPI002E25909D|nr:inactive serine/threonine-protein kinase 19-like [Corticium candelabrum]
MLRKRAGSFLGGAARRAKNDIDTDDDFCGTIPSDTEAALQYIESTYPPELKASLPRISLKHQVYAVVDDKTVVDRELERLQQENKIRLFKLSTGPDDYAVISVRILKAHLQSVTHEDSRETVDRFFARVLSSHNDVAISKRTLSCEKGFTERDVSRLIACGLLTVQDVGSYWISIPGLGLFMRYFVRGRDTVLRTLRKTKYNEMMQSELEVRKLATCKLGTKFHVLDLIGAELVTCVETTSGSLLHLNLAHEKNARRS